MNDAAKDAAEKMSRSKDLGKEEKASQEAKEKGESDIRTQKGGVGSGKDVSADAFDYRNVKPTYSWSAIIRKLVASVSARSDETYQKINKKTITSSHIARQTGFGVVKPGEITLEDSAVALVVDSSGSMMGVNAKIYSNFSALMTKNPSVHSKFSVIKFSNTYQLYSCDIKKKKYEQVDTLRGKAKVISSGTTDELFNETSGASTNFSGGLVKDMALLLKNKTNVLLCSDMDIIGIQRNLANLKELMGSSGANTNLFIILDSHATYVEALKALGSLSKNVSYFQE